ncbi:Uncharacterised protein [Staphylococcus gallinarum]|uniref:Uncharacterized protein n=1 Tax=Staphylococcus gallinarum TaxID=1293 RepID=A0A380FL05_STAGA|nr:Uncharacterised protein [Staphylococcus gallinarum]
MKKDDKLNVYEMIFTVIAIVFLTLGALILFDYIHINNQFGNLYFFRLLYNHVYYIY